MHGSRGYGRLFVRLGDAQIESGETFILARNIDTRLQLGMIDGETLYDFHFLIYKMSTVNNKL